MHLLQAARDAVTAENAIEHARSAIDVNVLVVACNLVGIAHMVAMVVGEEHALHHIGCNSVLGKSLEHFISIDSRIDEYTLSLGAHIRAITAAAAAEADEAHRLHRLRSGVSMVQRAQVLSVKLLD